MPQTVSVGELTGLVVRVFLGHGVSAENAGPVAETVVAAERDGAASHGLLRLPGYVSTLKSGWVDGRAVPVVADAAPGLVATEAANGFAQPALRASAPLLREKVRRQGIAAVAIRNLHHFAAVWPDIEPFAIEGLIAFAMVNGRQRMVVWGASANCSAPARWRLPVRAPADYRWFGTRRRASWRRAKSCSPRDVVKCCRRVLGSRCRWPPNDRSARRARWRIDPSVRRP
jgi:Malate/L-lactate dehydrogenase